MELATNMNRVIDYIDEHICENLDSEQLARLALCSSYHLSRMFPFLTGVTLSEYIRRRKLTLAALELSQSDISVLDAAVKYGYDSPTAFTQAFKNLHHITPSAAKEAGMPLMLYPKISFQLSLKGDIPMNYRLEKRDSFIITGLKEHIQKVNGDEDFARITQLWAQLDGDTAEKLAALSNGVFEGLLGASAANQDDAYDYYIGVSSDGAHLENTQQLPVPAGDWAVFQITGPLPDAMVTCWKRIFTEWFPGSGYESVNAPCLEIYSEGDITAADYGCELWVPVQKIR